MTVITHFLVGWTVANVDDLNQRERAAVAIAGTISDIDGLGIIAELLTWNSKHVLWWYHDYHHLLAHNLPFGLVVTIICFLVATQRWKTAALAFLSFHLHLLGDLVGSGGSDGYKWPIHYLYPFSDWTLTWEGQWELTAWPNVAITFVMLGIMLFIAWKRGVSPLEMISARANKAVVEALRDGLPPH